MVIQPLLQLSPVIKRQAAIGKYKQGPGRVKNVQTAPPRLALRLSPGVTACLSPFWPLVGSLGSPRSLSGAPAVGRPQPGLCLSLVSVLPPPPGFPHPSRALGTALGALCLLFHGRPMPGSFLVPFCAALSLGPSSP